MTSKGLELLEKISWRYVNDPSFQEWCNIIKQDLERLEELEKENAKLKKVIDILENKIVNILILKYCIAKGRGVETYNLRYKTEDQITQEEYDLLKEVLENE